ncbi:MAG: S41 family peptidase [Kofleriaceae bacterium]
MRWTTARDIIAAMVRIGGVVALVIASIAASGSAPVSAQPAKPAPTANQRATDLLWTAIETKYSYRDRLGLNWKRLFASHRKQLVGAATPAEFAAAAAKLLASAKDPHIWLTIGATIVGSYTATPTLNFQRDAIFRLVPTLKDRGRCIATGALGNGIIYVLIHSWRRERCGGLAAELAALIGQPGVANRMIIDVRPNGGGDETIARQVAASFVSAPVVYAQHVFRDASAPRGFSAPSKRVLQPAPVERRYRGKVAVLTGPMCMSSCEAFLLMMKAAGVPLVGETSRGASGNPQPIDLENGVVVFIPSWKAMRADGSALEGVGVSPDIKVTARPTATTDPVIDAAIRALAAP